MFTGVAGVLLAAGQGSRFGRPKALVELDGQTLAERGVATLLAGGADPILVVTGAAQVALAPEHEVHTVYNGPPCARRFFPRTWAPWWSRWPTSRWWARPRSPG